MSDAAERIANGAGVATTTVEVATPAELAARQSLLVEALRNLRNHELKLTQQCGSRVHVVPEKLDAVSA